MYNIRGKSVTFWKEINNFGDNLDACTIKNLSLVTFKESEESSKNY